MKAEVQKLDITLTGRLSVSIMDWNVCQQENGSDHNTILYNLSTSTTKIEPQWLWNKANWDLFQNELDKHLRISKPKIIKQSTINNMLSSFYKAIEEAMKEAIPKTKGKIIDNNNPCWTKDLQKMRTTLNKLKRKMDKKNNLANTEAYKKYRNEYKKLIQKTRDRSWNDYTCLLYTSPSPRDRQKSRMPSSA